MTYPPFTALSHLSRTFLGLKAVTPRAGNAIARWSHALRWWSSARDNPFWALARRGETRHGHPERSLLLGFVAWILVMVASTYFWNSADAQMQRLPVAQGRDAFGFLSLLWVNIFLGAGFVTARLRARSLLRAMLIKGQLSPLQHVPLEEEDKVWLLTAPPTLVGFIVALGALPGIGLGLQHGDWVPRDLLGLPFLLLVGLWNVPRWTPGTWQTQIEKTAPLVKGDGFWKPPQLGLSPSVWRAVFGSIVLVLLATPTIIGSFVSVLWYGLAPEVQQLAEACWLNWPLLASRFLVTPMPFFSGHIVPVFLLLPLWMATQDRKLLRLTAVLGASASFWTSTRQKRWLRDDWSAAALCLLLGIGVTWPVLIESALLDGFWESGALPALTGPEGALVAWFTVCAFGTACAASILWRETMASGPALANPDFLQSDGVPTPRDLWPLAWKRAGRAALAGGAVWLLSCALGGRAPLVPVALPFYLTALALGMLLVWTYAVVELDEVAFANSGPHPWHALLLKAVGLRLWWFYGGIAVFAFPAWWFFDSVYWQPWELAISPLSLWLAARFFGAIAAPWFWGALLLHALVGVYVWRRAWRELPAPTRGAPRLRWEVESALALPVQEERGLETGPRSVIAAKKPIAAAQPRAETIRPTRLSRPALLPPVPQQALILGWLRSFDNPLLILETRRLMGRGQWISAWRNALFFGALGFGFFATLVLRDTSVYRLAAGAQYCFGMVVCFAAIALIGYASNANDSYDRDRLEGTLESLFLSPLSEVAIAQSKVLPHFVLLWPLTLIPSVFLLFSAFVAARDGDPSLLALALLVPLCFFALVTRNITFSHLMAVVSRKTGQGTLLTALLGVPLFGFEMRFLLPQISYRPQLFPYFLVGYAALMLLEAVLLWHASVRQLKRLRRS